MEQIGLTEFLQIGIVGAALSLLIQFIKQKFGTDSWTTKGLTIAFAFIVGGAYVWLKDTVFWQTAVLVLGSSTVVYAFFLK